MAVSHILGIWNDAVGNLGVKTSLASITEQSAEAAACALSYPTIVQDMLRETDWSFLRVRSGLTEAASGAVWAPSWRYMFLYPSNCLFIRGFDLGVPASVCPQAAQVPYEVGYDASAGRVIYLNITDPVMIYTAYAWEPTVGLFEEKFDSSFRQALSWALAAAIAGPLTSNASIISAARQQAKETLDQARAANANEAAPNMVYQGAESLSVRGYDPYNAGALYGPPFFWPFP